MAGKKTEDSGVVLESKDEKNKDGFNPNQPVNEKDYFQFLAEQRLKQK